MLGAEAFKLKVMKIENQEHKKNNFNIVIGNKSMMSGMFGSVSSLPADVSDKKELEVKSITVVDPLLKNINDFVSAVKHEIVEIGSKKLLEIEKLYKEFKDTGGLENLDTVEDNLKQIEEAKR